jgi:peptide/nickel transport system permease protein
LAGREGALANRRVEAPAWLALLYRDKMVLASGTFLAVLLGLVLLSPLLPLDPVTQDLRLRLLNPFDTSKERFYVLGTDQLGRDIASRLIFGARISVTVGVLTPLIAVGVGVPLGLLAGFRRGWIDDLIMRVVDAWMSVPPLLVALLALFIVGPGFGNLVLVLAIMRWPLFARLTRALVLSLREELFVVAARSIGCSEPRILIRHILPGTTLHIAVLATLESARAILNEASLSFLGLGIQPPESSWGTMLADGRDYLFRAPWLIVLPGVVIVATTLSVNLVVSWFQPRRQGYVR